MRCNSLSTQEGATKEQFRFRWIQWELYNDCLPTVPLLTETMEAINSWSSSLDNVHSPDSLFPVSYESSCVPSLGYENSHKNVLLLFLKRGVYEQPSSQACLTFRNSNRKLRKLGGLSRSQPVHEESLPPIKYSFNGFAKLWFTALQGLACSLATFYPTISVLGRSSVESRSPSYGASCSGMFWFLLEPWLVWAHLALQHELLPTQFLLLRGKQWWGAGELLIYPLFIPWQCPHAGKTEGKGQGNSRGWTTSAPWTYSQQPDHLHALCFIHMVQTGSFKEQAGEGQHSFLSLYVEFLLSRAVEKNK